MYVIVLNYFDVAIFEDILKIELVPNHPVYVVFNLTFTDIQAIIFPVMQAVKLLVKQKTKKCYEQLPNVS